MSQGGPDTGDPGDTVLRGTGGHGVTDDGRLPSRRCSEPPGRSRQKRELLGGGLVLGLVCREERLL